MRDSERNVGRADHNPEAARKIAGGEQPSGDDSLGIDSADRHGHGAHGKGGGEEKVQDETTPEPGISKDQGRGSAGWGGESSGGSVIDKRPNR